LLAEGYTIPIYGERSGHCWLDITGEIENPVAVAVLFAVMAKQEQYGQDNNAKTKNPFLQAYRDKIIPYAQAPRFSAPFNPAFLKMLSDRQNALQKAEWTFEAKPLAPPQRIIAEGRDIIARELEKEFAVGKRFDTPAGPLVVKSVEAVQDKDDSKYRFADIHFAMPDGTFAGRYVFRASANEPLFVMTYEAKVYDGKIARAQEYEMAIGGLVMEWLRRNNYALLDRQAIVDVFNDATKFDQWDLDVPSGHLRSFESWFQGRPANQNDSVGSGQEAFDPDKALPKINLKESIKKIISNREGLELWQCRHLSDYEKEYIERVYNEYLGHLKEISIMELVALGAGHTAQLQKFISMPRPAASSKPAAALGFEFAQECAREALVQLQRGPDKKDGGRLVQGDKEERSVGGIDFSSMPIVTGQSSASIVPAMPLVSIQELERQWSGIQQQLNKGNAPYDKLKEYAAQCCSRNDASSQKGRIFDCVMNILNGRRAGTGNA